jgi:hypothetical protein
MAKKAKASVEVKLYSIKYIKYNDGTSKMERENLGFSAIELLGYLECIQLDIIDQMKGIIKPTKTKRIVTTK